MQKILSDDMAGEKVSTAEEEIGFCYCIDSSYSNDKPGDKYST